MGGPSDSRLRVDRDTLSLGHALCSASGIWLHRLSSPPLPTLELCELFLPNILDRPSPLLDRVRSGALTESSTAVRLYSDLEVAPCERFARALQPHLLDPFGTRRLFDERYAIA